MKLKPYSVYKETDIQGIGKIPDHWEYFRIKDKYRITNGSTPSSSEPLFWDGEIVWVTPEDLGKLSGQVILESSRRISLKGYRSCGTSLVPEGSLVVSTRAPIGYVAIAGIELCTNQGCKALVPRSPRNDRYEYYQLVSKANELQAKGEGSTFKELSKDALGETKLMQPTETEQRAIAIFLDYQLSKLGKLIEKQRRMAELLQEKRSAIITQALTRGLDPSVPMKDSGVEWLGQIPAHWEMKRLRHLVPCYRPIIYGIILPGPNVDKGVPLVKGGDISVSRLKTALLNKTTNEIEALHERSRLRSGDLVYAIRGSIGEVAMIPSELEGANITQDVARVSCREKVDADWLLFALRSQIVFSHLEAGSLGATIKGINIRDLRRVWIPTPPIGEQKELVNFLARYTAKLDELEMKINEAISGLGQYRVALISAAVTGKIDVRESAN